MSTSRRGMLCLLLTASVSTVGAEATDPNYRAVSDLGRLNGVALQCHYLDQVRRMKAAVVEHVPKDRSFGLAFDEATNAAFLEFVRGGESCPRHDRLEADVSKRIDDLATVFATR